MTYDFRAARNRIEELKSMYRRLAKVQAKNGTWDCLLRNQIGELEHEIHEAHKKKKTA